MARPVKKPSTKKPAKPAAPKKVVAAAKPVAKATVKPTAKAAAGKTVAKTPVAKGPAPSGPAPSAGKAALPVARKPRKPAFSPAELESIRTELHEQRTLYLRELEELEAGTFNVSQSDLSGEVSFDEESADAGTFTFERERDLSLGNNIRDLLDKVDSALRRIANGSYGECERCGRPIDKARLKALPYSVLCIDCKKLEERVR